MAKKLLLILLSCSSVFAARTVVTDTLRNASGGVCQGTLLISYPTFYNASNQLISGGSVSARVTNGVFSVSLEPGNYYTVTYNLTPGVCTINGEFWNVPVSATPVDLEDVRSLAVPTVPPLISLSSLAQGGATTNQCILWSGSVWAPGACSSSSAFSSITTGTNATATMTVGSGGTLTFTGTGIVNANRIMGAAVSGISGIVKMASGVPSAAVAGTDYSLLTQVVIAGTSNQITVSGTCTITSTGTCTLSIPSSLQIPGTINKITITQPATGSTFTLADGKTFTVNKSITLDGTDSTTITFPSSSATVATLGLTNTFTGRQDASGAASTAPFKVGTSAPVTCTVGDLFYDSDATAGSNLYACTSTNTWTLESGGGGGMGCTTSGSANQVLVDNGAGGCSSSTTTLASSVVTIPAVAAPSTPGAGTAAVYVDSTNKVLSDKNDAGTVHHTVATADCSSGSQLVQKINADGSVTCAAGGGGGLSVSGWYLTDGVNYYSGPHMAPMTLPNAASLSWSTTQGGATETANGNALILKAPAAAGSNLRMRGMSISGSSTLTGHVSVTGVYADYSIGGLVFRESSSNKLITLSFQNTSAQPSALRVDKYTDANNFNSQAYLSPSGVLNSQWLSMRLIYTSGSPGTITFQTSSDDVTWVTVFTENANSFFSTAPDQWGYFANSQNATYDTYVTLYSLKVE